MTKLLEAIAITLLMIAWSIAVAATIRIVFKAFARRKERRERERRLREFGIEVAKNAEWFAGLREGDTILWNDGKRFTIVKTRDGYLKLSNTQFYLAGHHRKYCTHEQERVPW